MSKRALINIFVITIITIVFAVYLQKNFHEIKKALAIKPSFLCYLVLLNVANKVCAGFKTKKIIEVFKIKLSFLEWFGMTAVNNFYNYIAPKSGTILAGVYFKNKHEFNYHKYVSMLITVFTITILTSGVLGAAVTLYTSRSLHAGSFILVILFGLMIIAPGIVLLMPRIRFPHTHYFRKVNECLEGWHLLRRQKRLLFILALMDFCIIILTAVRYYIIFRMFSVPASLATCIILSPFNIIIHVAAIIPGAYGIKEAAIGLLSQLTNIGFASGALATLSDRIVGMAVSFVLGPIFSFLLLKRVFIFNKNTNTNG